MWSSLGHSTNFMVQRKKSSYIARKIFSGKVLQIKKCLIFVREKLTIFTKHFILDVFDKVFNTPPTFFCGQGFEYVSLNKYLL